MKPARLTQYILFILLPILCFSCRKDDAYSWKQQLTGLYTGEVREKQQWINGWSSDTTYSDSSEVTSNEQLLLIFDHTVPADSVRHGVTYKAGTYSNYYTVRFVEDSLYYFSFNSSLGGWGSFSFKGRKE